MAVDFSKIKKVLTSDIGSGSKGASSSISKERNYKPKEVVAFDIGSNTIKVVVGKYSKNRLQVHDMFSFQTPDGAIEDGKITNQNDLTIAIRSELQKHNVKAKDAVLATSSSTIISRDISIPVVEEDEMETVIKYEIEQYLPIKLDDYIIQYVVLDKIVETSGVKYKVNVVAYPKITAQGYYDLMTSLDLNPYVLDVNFNSLKKIVSHTGSFNGGTVAFVDMGATSINVTIFKNGKLDFTRVIKYGGDSIDYALSSKLNMSAKATESEKINKSTLVNVSSDDVVSMTVKETMDEILSELERILQFYNNQSVGGRVQNLLIYGGSSNIKGLETYMGDRISIKTSKMDRLANIEFTGVNNGESVGKYINAIGAIIRY